MLGVQSLGFVLNVKTTLTHSNWKQDLNLAQQVVQITLMKFNLKWKVKSHILLKSLMGHGIPYDNSQQMFQIYTTLGFTSTAKTALFHADECWFEEVSKLNQFDQSIDWHRQKRNNKSSKLLCWIMYKNDLCCKSFGWTTAYQLVCVNYIAIVLLLKISAGLF